MCATHISCKIAPLIFGHHIFLMWLCSRQYCLAFLPSCLLPFFFRSSSRAHVNTDTVLCARYNWISNGCNLVYLKYKEKKITNSHCQHIMFILQMGHTEPEMTTSNWPQVNWKQWSKCKKLRKHHSCHLIFPSNEKFLTIQAILSVYLMCMPMPGWFPFSCLIFCLVTTTCFFFLTETKKPDPFNVYTFQTIWNNLIAMQSITFGTFQFKSPFKCNEMHFWFVSRFPFWPRTHFGFI